MKNHWKSLQTIAVLLATVTACGGPQQRSENAAVPAAKTVTAPDATSEQSEVGTIATDISCDVGTVGQIASAGTQEPVFIFAEYHTSRVGQLQIATMLLRLHDRYGLRVIGLEGDTKTSAALDGGWFHAAGGKSSQEDREDVALRMLGEGEISAAEFMVLVFPDVRVCGIEKAEEYQQELNVKGGSEAAVLARIAEKKLTQADIRKLNELIQKDKKTEAMEYLLTADKWVKEHFEALKNPPGSVEAVEQTINEVRKKAKEVGVTVEPEEEKELQSFVQFLRMASQRSATMCDQQAKLLQTAAGKPTAMIIGAAHTERIIESFRQRGISFALLKPIALNPDYGSLSIEQFQRKNHNQWARTTEGTLGRLLNSQRKPPPVIETASVKSYASALLATKLIAEAARRGKRVPDDVRSRLDGLPECQLDWESFTQDGYDVIFRMWLQTTSGGKREIWARVGTADNKEAAKTLEEKLLQRIGDLGGDRKWPPQEPPPRTISTADKEGPGDGSRGDLTVSRIGREALAVFAASKSKATEVGGLSG